MGDMNSSTSLHSPTRVQRKRTTRPSLRVPNLPNQQANDPDGGLGRKSLHVDLHLHRSPPGRALSFLMYSSGSTLIALSVLLAVHATDLAQTQWLVWRQLMLSTQVEGQEVVPNTEHEVRSLKVGPQPRPSCDEDVLPIKRVRDQAPVIKSSVKRCDGRT